MPNAGPGGGGREGGGGERLMTVSRLRHNERRMKSEKSSSRGDGDRRRRDGATMRARSLTVGHRRVAREDLCGRCRCTSRARIHSKLAQCCFLDPAAYALYIKSLLDDRSQTFILGRGIRPPQKKFFFLRCMESLQRGHSAIAELLVPNLF